MIGLISVWNKASFGLHSRTTINFKNNTGMAANFKIGDLVW